MENNKLKSQISHISSRYEEENSNDDVKILLQYLENIENSVK